MKVGEGTGRNSTEVCCEKEVAGGQRIFIRGLVIIKSLFFSFANLTHSLSAGDSALYVQYCASTQHGSRAGVPVPYSCGSTLWYNP